MPTTVERPPRVAEAPPASLGRLWLATVAVFLVVATAAAVAVLWPNEVPPRDVSVGKSWDVLRTVDEQGHPLYLGDGDFFLIRYAPRGADDPYAGVTAGGLMALSAVTPHLGQPLVYCRSSGWFEDLRHGSKFNAVGERMPGSPAPAGMWRHPIRVTEHGDVYVDRHRLVEQPPLGRDTLHQEPEGPHCWRFTFTGSRIVGP
jgi:hypothetical protein